jgi:FtsP/CotA-like multicopper oxidase with cupredoxin domain
LTARVAYQYRHRCIPAEALDALLGGQGKPDVYPEGVFHGCTPTRGSVEKIQVPGKKCTPESWVALDIIGAYNFHTSVFSIDEHDMWVYAMDGSYITPQKVQAIVAANGERYSVLIRTHEPGNYKMRASSVAAPQIMQGYAILSVGEHADGDEADSEATIGLVGNPLRDDVVFFDQNVAAPFPPEPIAQKADALFRLDMLADGASHLWAMNSSRLMPIELEYKTPVLFSPQPFIQNNVTITTKNGTWIDLIFYASEFPMPPHPIHKHGNKMYQIGMGSGNWTWSSVEEAMKEIPDNFNLDDPPRRDGFLSPPAETSTAWTAVRYHVTNPGAWLLHCHINNHAVGGMNIVIQDGIDAWPEIPDEYNVSE